MEDLPCPAVLVPHAERLAAGLPNGLPHLLRDGEGGEGPAVEDAALHSPDS